MFPDIVLFTLFFYKLMMYLNFAFICYLQLPMRLNGLMQYTTDSEAANGDIRRIEGDLTQAKQRLGDMEMEARGLSEPTRRELGNKVKVYRSNLDTIAADLTKAKQKYQRGALLGSGASAGRLDFNKSQDQRERMMQTNEKLRGGTNQLNDAQRRLEETLDVGEGIVTELGRNRETLTRIRGNAGVVGGTLDEARRIIRSMSKREVRTKIAVGVFAIAMLAIIGSLIYWVVKVCNRSFESLFLQILMFSKKKINVDFECCDKYTQFRVAK
jgi:Vesicle transport v-SNARE protein N-terminus/Snare region anchored in the vesicle membrane C-terminus